MFPQGPFSAPPPPPYVPSRPESQSTISIDNVKEGETVHQRFLLLNGRAGPHTGKHDGAITVVHNDFPQQQWPCVDSYFKALVHLAPGPNTFTIVFQTEQLHFHVNYVPLLQNPPLSLVIFVGRDSPGTFDVPPQKNRQNSLDFAVEKLRMAGYMWQAFCAEQMYRHGMGRRTFRLDEAWLADTVSSQDKGKMRQTAQVYIVKSKYTVAEIRDVRRAQQSKDRNDDLKDLFAFVLEGLEHTPPFNKPCHVAALLLDSHWDPKKQVLLGHAALGGGAGDTALGIFGSHLIHAWPCFIEEIVPCMMNNTPTDTRYLSNDANESGHWWKALNIGMGAMLHEVGHSFTLTHTPTGIMSRGFNHFNRTFTAKEPGIQPIPSTEEKGSHWHRADIMRLRFHPGFRIPLDGPIGTTNKQGPSFVLLCSNRFEIMAPAGLSMIELFVNEQYKTHIEYLDEQPTAVSFSLEEIGQRCGWRANQKLSIEATCVNQTQKRIENMTEFFTSGQVRLPGMNGNVIKSDGYGLGGLGGASKYSSVFYRNGRPKQLRQINVHHGSFLDGFVLIWQDGTHDTIGKTGGGLSRFSIQNGESIRGFHIHSGAWVDGLQFILSSGRLSDWYGGKGGSLSTVVAPQGHHLVGFYGTAGQWMDQLGVYYQQST